jgi:hypothetical protein
MTLSKGLRTSSIRQSCSDKRTVRAIGEKSNPSLVSEGRDNESPTGHWRVFQRQEDISD